MLTEQLTPKELVHKHIFDKSHIVTEEELQNVKVGFLYGEDDEYKKTQEHIQVRERIRYKSK
jgi:hypothetical protein